MSKMVSKVRGVFRRLEVACLCSLSTLLTKVSVLAETKEDIEETAQPYDFLKTDKNNTMFSGLQDLISSTTASGVSFLQTLGYVLIFISIACIGVGFMWYRNPGKVSENKGKVGIVIIAAACIFGVGGIGAIVASIGDSI